LNNLYEDSLALSKADRLWRDALETAAASKQIAVAEELAGYFVSIGNKDAFTAILYVCFELVRPDFVEEMVSLPFSALLTSVMAVRSRRLRQALLPAAAARPVDKGESMQCNSR
jgi:hypothetical protein